MIQWGTQHFTQRAAALGATASTTLPHLQIPAFTPLLQGVEQGGPGLSLLRGGLALRSRVSLPLSPRPESLGFGLAVCLCP